MSNANIQLSVGFIDGFLKGKPYIGNVYLKVESGDVLRYVDPNDDEFIIYGCNLIDGSAKTIVMIWFDDEDRWNFNRGDIIQVIGPTKYLLTEDDDDSTVMEVKSLEILSTELNDSVTKSAKRKRANSKKDDDDENDETDDEEQTPSTGSEPEIVPNTPPSKQPFKQPQQKRQKKTFEGITSLAQLKPHKGQKIRVVVNHEATVALGKNNGNYFNDLTLIDESGYVRCIAFDHAARNFAKQLKYGHTYIIENFKYQTRVYKNMRYGEVTFGMDTRIADITKDGMLDFIFDFTPLDKVINANIVDIVAVVVRVDDIKEVKTGDKSWRERVIIVADDCGHYIEVKLYNNNTTISILPGTVITLKRGVVNSYAGVCNLKVSNQSYMGINPEIEERESLSQWYAGKDGVFSDVLPMCEHIKMSEIASKFASCEANLFRFKCDVLVSEVHTHQICYEACIDCKKKLSAIEDERWFCQKCQKQKIDFVLHYKLTLIVEGDDQIFEMTAFDSAARELFESKSAKEMMELKTKKSDKFDSIIDNIVGRKYHLICCASEDKSKSVQYRIESFVQCND